MNKGLIKYAAGWFVTLSVLTAVSADDWPQWMGPQRDGVWREAGILEKFPEGGPKVRWRMEIGGGYAGPAVAGGRVYVTDRQLAMGSKNPDDPFQVRTVKGTERVVCLNEGNGEILWKHEYDCDYRIQYPSGPRTTPVLYRGKVYALGAMGDLVCLDAVTGKLVWSKSFPKEYDVEPPVWGWSAHPLVYGDMVICMVGGEGTTVVAFHKDTGKEVWRALTAKEPGYCPPMLYEYGGKLQVIIWHPEAISGLDPSSGKEIWSQPFAVNSGLSIATPRKEGDLLLVTAFYNGPMLLKIERNSDEPTIVWKGKSNSELSRRTDKLHALISTPIIKDGHIYGVCSYGQLRCLELESGRRVWETFKATTSDNKEARWANAFIVRNADRFFLFNEKGDLIIARLTPDGYEELDRANLLQPTNRAMNRNVVWSHPAFANRSVYARNDKEIVCVSVAAE